MDLRFYTPWTGATRRRGEERILTHNLSQKFSRRGYLCRTKFRCAYKIISMHVEDTTSCPLHRHLNGALVSDQLSNRPALMVAGAFGCLWPSVKADRRDEGLLGDDDSHPYRRDLHGREIHIQSGDLNRWIC